MCALTLKARIVFADSSQAANVAITVLEIPAPLAPPIAPVGLGRTDSEGLINTVIRPRRQHAVANTTAIGPFDVPDPTQGTHDEDDPTDDPWMRITISGLTNVASWGPTSFTTPPGQFANRENVIIALPLEFRAGSAMAGMNSTPAPRKVRRDLWSFNTTELERLIQLMSTYLTDDVVNNHWIMHGTMVTEDVFAMHRPMLEKMENHIRLNATPEEIEKFVPFPKWEPETGIPGPFRAVRAPDMPLTQLYRPPLNNDIHFDELALPERFRLPGVRTNFHSRRELAIDIAPLPFQTGIAFDPSMPDMPFVFGGWHKIVHDGVGGTMHNPLITAAAYIFWPFHARMDDVLADFESGPAASASMDDGMMTMPLTPAPDVYIRDYNGDNGDPHNQPIGLSPDVILRNYRVSDPQAEFGEGSDTVDGIPVENVAAGGTKFVYLRMRNRGAVDAFDVPAVAFWAPTSTFFSPDNWRAIGGVTLPCVPAGNILTVSDAIPWPPEIGQPADGHMALIAWANLAPEDALFPFQESFASSQQLEDYIRANNNIAVRNYRIIPYNPRPWKTLDLSFVSLPFLAGAGGASRMSLEVQARLPAGARVVLKAPQGLVKLLRARAPRTERTLAGNHGYVPCRGFGRSIVGEGIWPAKANFPCELLVHLPSGPKPGASFEIFARQVCRGREVGRATWRVVAGAASRPRLEVIAVGSDQKKDRKRKARGQRRS